MQHATFAGIFLTLILSAAPVWAASTCHIQDAVRCLCPAILKVSCDNGASGQIKNETSISSITLRTVDDVGIEKTITLQNPPGGVSQYYSAKDNPWIKAQLAAQGVRYKEVFGQSFTTETAPVLYQDSSATTLASENEKTFGDGIQCNVLSQTADQKICKMKVHCTQAGKDLGDGEAACKVISPKKCPTATLCAHDQDVAVPETSLPTNAAPVTSSHSGAR